MNRSIRILAVSRMDGGVCVAGVEESSGRWIRPVKDYGSVLKTDLYDADGEVIEPLDLVTFNVIRRQPSPPHVEDRITAFDRPLEHEERPESDEERRTILASLSEGSPDDVLIRKTRSLVLVRPDEISMVSFDPNSFGKYKVRLSFTLSGRAYQGEARSSPGYPVTDIRLRNWGRRYGTRKIMTGPQLRQALKVDEIDLVLGLARPMNGAIWPMDVGFHTVPDFDGSIDLKKP